jgi:hypothetical protein
MRADFTVGEVQLRLSVLVGVPSAATEDEREAMRICRVRLSGMRSMVSDPPGMIGEFADRDGIDVDGGMGVPPGEQPMRDDGLTRLWLFVLPWNKTLSLTVDRCELEWEQ